MQRQSFFSLKTTAHRGRAFPTVKAPEERLKQPKVNQYCERAEGMGSDADTLHEGKELQVTTGHAHFQLFPRSIV